MPLAKTQSLQQRVEVQHFYMQLALQLLGELHCSAEGCQFIKKQHPSATELAAKSAGLGFNTYVATYLCKEHRPKKAHQFSAEGRAAREAQAVANGEAPKHRGRPKNPAFEGIPKTAICIVCKKEVAIVAQNILDKSSILGKTVEEFLKEYRCRECGGKITKEQKAAYKKRLKKELKEKKAN